MRLEVRILGTLEVRAGDAAVRVPPGKQRALLLLLAVHAPRDVGAESVVEALWPEAPLGHGLHRAHVTVSRVRATLGPAAGALETAAGRYWLSVAPDDVDAAQFERLAAAARASIASGRREDALSALEAALALWRGPALADARFAPWAQGEIARLEEQRASVREARIGVLLDLGRHATVVGELEQLVADHPAREGLAVQLMTALYRSGRHADALGTYRRWRRRLDEELGLQPGPALRQLEAAILRQDPALGVPAPSPPHAGATPRSRLPVPPTPIVGRDAALADVRKLLATGTRLVTITGPGGAGKTRLALELARTAPASWGPAVLAELAPVPMAGAVESAVAAALGVELAGDGAAEEIARAYAGRPALLVLDNFEHVVDAAPLVADLHARCDALRIVVTSREALRVRAEAVFALPALSVDASAALLVARVCARDPEFSPSAVERDAIARICRRLDGLPLAIELAAARLDLLSPGELADRLERSLGALGSGPRDAPARQRTLRATIEWSYQLLAEPERDAFAALSVFAGRCGVGAAEAITGAPLEVLTELVAKSLAVAEDAGGHRRIGLLETVREVARERLELRADHRDVARRHCEWYLALAERMAPELRRRGRVAWGARLEQELAELRAAMRWASVEQPILALRLAIALRHAWWTPEPDLAGWIADALERTRGRASPQLYAGALLALADVADEVAVARTAALDALRCAERAGDPGGMADAATVMAWTHRLRQEEAEARRWAQKAVHHARTAGDARLLAEALTWRAAAAPTMEDAIRDTRDAALLYDRQGNHEMRAHVLTNAAYSAIVAGAHDEAGRLLADARAASEAARDEAISAYVASNAGVLAILEGRLMDARADFLAALAYAAAHRRRAFAGEPLAGLAAIAAAGGADAAAARLLGAAEAADEGTYARQDPVVITQLQTRHLEPARARAGDAAWTREMDAGRRLGLDEALALAGTTYPGSPAPNADAAQTGDVTASPRWHG